MLYVTTRSDNDPKTAYHALTETRAEDGGLYLPMGQKRLSQEEIAALKEKSFGEAVAEILNRFFSTHLTGWDVEFAIGRYPVRLQTMSHRMILTETWHNPDWDFSRMIGELCSLLTGDQTALPGEWGVIAIRIAVLFGVFAELLRSGELTEDTSVDISVTSGDLSGPMAAVYAREMGLPIANVVVCCNENCGVWDLVSKGELRTGLQPLKTALPECDHVLPDAMERLIHFCGGEAAVGEYLHRVGQGGVYFPDEETCGAIRACLQVSVISSKRILMSLKNIYKTTGKVLGPYAALTWCGLMDYRARTGESRLSLVLSERSAHVDGELVAEAMGMTPEALGEIL